MERKTGFDWCLQEKIRPLQLSQWPTQWAFYEESFFRESIDYTDFLDRIRKCEVKPNSQPRKTEGYLEYRMYGLVMYNLSDIQKGIQFGHAVVEYAAQYSDTLRYKAWQKDCKTFIILSGGTSNRSNYSEYSDKFYGFGTMEMYGDDIKNNNVPFATFYEPDLNNATSAIVFLVDERVFDRETYPDFVKNDFLSDEINKKHYDKWVEKVGGEQNVFLRSFLPKFKLA